MSVKKQRTEAVFAAPVVDLTPCRPEAYVDAAELAGLRRGRVDVSAVREAARVLASRD